VGMMIESSVVMPLFAMLGRPSGVAGSTEPALHRRRLHFLRFTLRVREYVSARQKVPERRSHPERRGKSSVRGTRHECGRSGQRRPGLEALHTDCSPKSAQTAQILAPTTFFPRIGAAHYRKYQKAGLQSTGRQIPLRTAIRKAAASVGYKRWSVI
jgi:hypothetical protein